MASATSFAAEFGIPRAHGSYEALLDDPGVDVVYIASPHNFHAAQAIAALGHGKHVLVEKAFTLTAAEAHEVAELGRRNGLLVMEAMWTRFLPHMAFVRSVIADARLGQVTSLHADHTQRLPADPGHRINDPRLAGGALLDLGSYPISFACDLLGPPSEVSALATFKDTGVDGSVATIFRHRGGALSTTYSSSETRGRNTAVVLGTEARLEISAVWYTPAVVTVYAPDDRVIDTFDRPVSGRGMQYQAAELESRLNAGETRSPLLTPDESVSIMSVMDDIRIQIGLRYPGEPDLGATGPVNLPGS
jgi:predicted dehydrogenase